MKDQVKKIPIQTVLKTDDVAVIIEADHLCVKSRGVNDVNSVTLTSSYNGKFLNGNVKAEFISSLKDY